MEDAEIELKRRRERGRSAQAAFRQRQAKAAQDMKRENERLTEALKSIVKIARADDRSELVSVIVKAAEASGIDADHLELTESSPENDSPHTWQATSSSRNSNEDCIGSGSAAADPQSSIALQQDLVVVHKPAFKATRCMMWLNPLRQVRIDKPPDDIVPYLGPGANTLAGKIFWTVMEHALTDCHHVHRPTRREDFDKNPCFRRMMDHSVALQNISHSFMKAMVEARLEYRQLGYISSEYASAAELDAGAVMKRKILQDYVMSGKDPNIWLTPIAVEARARSILGPHGFLLLTEVTKRPENDALHISLSSLVQKLVANFICFGDGPRWAIHVVDEAFSQWYAEIA